MIGLEGETTGQWHLMIGLEGETTGQWHLMIGLEGETTGPIGTKFGLFGFPIFWVWPDGVYFRKYMVRGNLIDWGL